VGRTSGYLIGDGGVTLSRKKLETHNIAGVIPLKRTERHLRNFHKKEKSELHDQGQRGSFEKESNFSRYGHCSITLVGGKRHRALQKRGGREGFEDEEERLSRRKLGIREVRN